MLKKSGDLRNKWHSGYDTIQKARLIVAKLINKYNLEATFLVLVSNLIGFDKFPIAPYQNQF